MSTLSELDKELERFSAFDSKGFVAFSSDKDILFSYEVKKNGIDINLTSAGMLFFKSKISMINGLNTFEFANYLGLKPESVKDFCAMIKVEDPRYVKAEDVIVAAKEKSQFCISNSKANLDIIFHQKHGLVDKRSVFNPSEGFKKLDEILLSNVVKSGTSRSVSSIYVESNGKLLPYMVKTANPNSSQENAKLVFEHAALTALKMNGVTTPDSQIKKTLSGKTYLFTNKFDSKPLAINGQSDDKFSVIKPIPMFFAPMAWSNLVQSGSQKTTELSQRKVSSQILENSGNLRGTAKQALITHCFNVLIGNSDINGYNSGSLKIAESGTQISSKAAPVFDINPDLMWESDSAARSNFSNKSLASLSFADCFSKDRVDQQVISRIGDSFPGILEEAFEVAVLARKDMISNLKSEGVKKGFISQNQVGQFIDYLNANPSGVILASGNNNVFKEVPDAKDRFIKRVTDNEMGLTASLAI